MRDSGLFCDDVVHVESLKFCFVQFYLMSYRTLQINESVELAQDRTIKKCKISRGSRPDTLYFVPQMTVQGTCIIIPIALDDIEIAEERACYRRTETGCADEFCELTSMPDTRYF